MPKITLKLRDLDKGDQRFEEFDGEEQTIAYLRARPNMVDVLGVAFEGLTPEQNARLKEAMRPLDAAELAAEKKLEEEVQRAHDAAREVRAKEEEVARAAHRETMKTADPHRVMELRYRYNSTELEPVDPEDTREISQELRDAVKAWVAERNEWVESRNQVVGEAKISCWPGNLPKPGADRIQNGTFIPVTAPPKKPD